MHKAQLPKLPHKANLQESRLVLSPAQCAWNKMKTFVDVLRPPERGASLREKLARAIAVADFDAPTTIGVAPREPFISASFYVCDSEDEIEGM